MATKKISQLTAKGANLESTDLIPIADYNGSTYDTKYVTGQEIIDAVGGGSSSGIFGISDSSGTYTYYTTLTLAMAAAVSGDTIEVFADVTESTAVTITLKDGVNINGNGHTYTYTFATGDSFNDSGVAVNCQINNLNIVRNNYTSGAVYNQTSTSSDTNWNGSTIIMTASSGYAVDFRGTIRNINVKVVGNGTAIYSANALTCYLYNSYGESTGSGNGINAQSGFIYNSVGKSVSGTGCYFFNSKAYNTTGISTSGYGINQGTLYNCQGVSSTNNGIRDCTSYNCTGISTSSGGINGSGVAYESTSIGGNYVSQPFYNCTITSNLSAVIGSSGSTSDIINCNLICTWNNASGHGFTTPYSSAPKIVNSTIKVANTSANCINTLVGSTTMAYANNTFIGATTPVNANIIQTITNTSDSQGNILV